MRVLLNRLGHFSPECRQRSLGNTAKHCSRSGADKDDRRNQHCRRGSIALAALYLQMRLLLMR